MNCPFCGAEMQTGRIQSNGSTLLFSVKEHSFLKLARNGDVQLARELNASVPAYHCPSCKKIVVDYSLPNGN